MTTVSLRFEPHNRGESSHPSVPSVLYGLFAGKLVWRLRLKAIFGTGGPDAWKPSGDPAWPSAAVLANHQE
jgi:hypothetical protein